MFLLLLRNVKQEAQCKQEVLFGQTRHLQTGAK